MNKPSLSERFAEAARSSPALRFLFGNASRISSLGYASGNLVLLSKNGLTASMDSAAGLLYLGSTACLWFAKHNPALLKTAGYFIMTAAATLGASAYGQPGFASQVAGALPSLATGFLMTLGGAPPVESESEGGLKRTLLKPYRFLRQNPVMSGGVIDAVGKPLLMNAAVARGDTGLAITALLWGIGSLGLANSDPNIQAEFRQPAPEQKAQPRPA